MTGDALTMLIIFNGVINLVILYMVAPLYNLKGKICMIQQMLNSHDMRIAACEEKV